MNSPAPSLPGLLSCRLLALALVAALPANAAEEKPTINPSRIIQYRGPMPPLPRDTWGQTVELRFELYRSPTGGSPFWEEKRKVAVSKTGWVEVDLGESAPLPDEAFTTPFRFLAISHQGKPFFTRKQIASLVYVASPLENTLFREDKSYVAQAMKIVRAAAALAPDRDQRLDRLVDCGAFAMEKHPRMPAPWVQAAEAADKLGARLPTFQEWYSVYDGKPGKQLVAMQGHYEWVIPWVYEPSIHARFHELYRGKPAACYYNELSPLNNYAFRFVGKPADKPQK